MRPSAADGAFFVFSGRDGSLLWRVQGDWWPDLFGFALLGDIDVTGDGRLDVVVGSHYANDRQGAIHVYSKGGTLLYSVQGDPQHYWLGRSLAKVGDVNGDGSEDFVAGAWDGPLSAAFLIWGRTGRILHGGGAWSEGVFVRLP